jgi:hypothetical protein
MTDTFNLLDKVLLHEMTHGHSVYTKLGEGAEEDQMGLVDVDAPGGYLGLNIIPAAAYGWSKTTTLAKKGGRLGEINGPDNNADTLALFASSTYILMVNIIQ